MQPIEEEPLPDPPQLILPKVITGRSADLADKLASLGTWQAFGERALLQNDMGTRPSA